jgi:Inner membrane protein YgaP-like, transmembrane domain
VRLFKEVTVSIAESFGRSRFAQFVNSPAGRLARLVAGAGLIGWGYTQRGTGTGLVFIAVGLVPLTAGAFNLCLISALLGGPLSGARIAKSKQ